jgi:hypothetical protein
MQARSSASEQLFAELLRFKGAWLKGGWSWDYRFSTVASSFHVDVSEEARGIVLGYLQDEFTMKTVSNAPAAIREVAEAAGGIRTDQRIYSSRPSGRLLAYGMWWPWGDELTISLRVGLAGYVRESDNARLQELFNAIS